MANKAVDGNDSGQLSASICTHTKSEDKPWWRVDLRSPTLITQLVIFNRADCCRERLHSFTIRIGDSLANNGNANPLCGGVQSMKTDLVKTFRCPNPVVGRYVTIQLQDRNYLTLCEVVVNGVKGE